VTLRRSAVLCVLAFALGANVLWGSSAPAAEGVGVQAMASPSDGAPVATDVRLGGDDKQTRFIMDFDRPIDMAAFTLADPYRVVVDMPQVMFKLSPNVGDQGRGLVKAFRFGLIMQGGSRIVLDTKGPVRVEKAFTIPAADGQPARLVLDLVATDRDGFLRNIAQENRPERTAAKHNNDPMPKDDDPRPLIVLDPGHGGIDTGTRGLDGTNEKDVVLAFGQTLREKLEAGGKYRVAMTRTDDTFVPLNERVRFARARCRRKPPTRRPLGSPSRRTGPTPSPASISPPSRMTSPISWSIWRSARPRLSPSSSPVRRWASSSPPRGCTSGP
jgi:N-acetylmuramoyl-L-alanine amidase